MRVLWMCPEFFCVLTLGLFLCRTSFSVFSWSNDNDKQKEVSSVQFYGFSFMF